MMREEVLAYLRMVPRANAAMIAQDCMLDRDEVQAVLHALDDQGEVLHDETGWYALSARAVRERVWAAEPAWRVFSASGALDGEAVATLVRMDCSTHDIASRCAAGLHYLATPYSREVVDYEGDWREERSAELGLRAAQAAAALAAQGVTAISPIAQASGMVAMPFGPGGDRLDPLDAAFWDGWCRPLLQRCDSVIVAPIAGWERSRGVWAEVMTALERSKPVFVWRGN